MNRLLNNTENLLKNTNVVALCSIRGPVTKDILGSALDYLATIHPILNSEIVESSHNNYSWQPMNNGKKWYVFETITDVSQSIDIAERVLNEDPIRTCLAHVFLVQRKETGIVDVIMGVNHAVFDGRSLYLFLEQLIFVMACVHEGKEPNIKKETGIDSQKDLMSSSLSESDLSSPFATLPIQTRVLAGDRKWAMVSRKIPSDDSFLSNLTKASNKRGVSLNSAILASFIEAFDLECKKLDFKNPPNFRVSSAVNVLGDMPTQIGTLNSTNLTLEIGKKEGISFWDIARDYNQQLKRELGAKAWGSSAGNTVAYFSNEYADSVLYESQGRLFSFWISNVGNVNKLMGKKQEKVWCHSSFEVEDIMFMDKLALYGPCFILAIAMFNGNVCYTIGFPVPTYERALIRRILDSAISIARSNSDVAKL